MLKVFDCYVKTLTQTESDCMFTMLNIIMFSKLDNDDTVSLKRRSLFIVLIFILKKNS